MPRNPNHPPMYKCTQDLNGTEIGLANSLVFEIRTMSTGASKWLSTVPSFRRLLMVAQLVAEDLPGRDNSPLSK